MEKQLKQLAKTPLPPPVDCIQRDENIEELLCNKSGKESDFQTPSVSSCGTNQRKFVRKYLKLAYSKLGFIWNHNTNDPFPQSVTCYEILASESMRLN